MSIFNQTGGGLEISGIKDGKDTFNAYRNGSGGTTISTPNGKFARICIKTEDSGSSATEYSQGTWLYLHPGKSGYYTEKNPIYDGSVSGIVNFAVDGSYIEIKNTSCTVEGSYTKVDVEYTYVY